MFYVLVAQMPQILHLHLRRAMITVVSRGFACILHHLRLHLSNFRSAVDTIDHPPSRKFT